MLKRSKNVGVVLATFNGAKHLATQLNSIRGQTMLPAEVIICDDRSSDETINILQEFQRGVDFPVQISINDQTLGPTENFFHAASKSHLEYIALCDQDDIWLERKIELCDASIDEAHPSLVLHAYVEFYQDESGAEVVSKRWPLPDWGLIPGRATSPSIIWRGMSLVAKRSLFDNAGVVRSAWYPYRDRIRESRPEILYNHWADCHDLFLLNRARMEGAIYLISEVCAKHRTRDGGFHSDPKGSPFKPPPEIELVCDSSRASPYITWSLFCADFLDYLNDIDGARHLSEARSYYERWSRLWSNRAAIHSETSALASRFKALASNLKNGAYRSQWAGGFGRRSLVKDGLGALGVKVG